jgi:peroxiredoxin
MRDDLRPGNDFPDVRLPDQTGEPVAVREVASGSPLIVAFVRGWWCPKEQLRLRGLTEMQDEIQREYGGLVAVTVDPPYVNGALRAGLGAAFDFLSDEDRRVAEELDLLELTDAGNRPFLPFTFVLDSLRRVHAAWCGFWYWGNPTPDELRLALREITRTEQPTLDPQTVWTNGGAAPPDAGIDAATVLVREDAQGRELSRGAFREAPPDVGAEVDRSVVDGRPWIVDRIERADGRIAVHVRKGGRPRPGSLPKHRITVPHFVR